MSEQERDEKTALTKAAKAAAAELDLHADGDPRAYLEQFYEKAKARLEEELEQRARRREIESKRRAQQAPTSYQNRADETSTVASEEVDEGGVCLIRHTPPVPESDAKRAPQEKRYKVLILDDPPGPDIEHDPEDTAAWKQLSERMRSQPVEVTTVEIGAAASDNFAVEPSPS